MIAFTFVLGLNRCWQEIVNLCKFLKGDKKK
jgi:hypothetical protein